MDNYSIKSVAFGGFDKQDVIRYIEQTAQQAAQTEKALQEECEQLRSQNTAAEENLKTLQEQLEEALKAKDALQTAYDDEHALRVELEALKPLTKKLEDVEAELAAIRPDAEAYAQFRERIGAIECEARKRADDLETATLSQLQKTVDQFREQYQILMHTFESTASHVTSELRKIDVTMTHLPRAMDQAGNELNTLAAQLKSNPDQ